MSKEVEEALQKFIELRQGFDRNRARGILEALEEAVTQRTIDEYSERHKP